MRSTMAAHFLELFRVPVEEIELHRCVRADAYYDDARFLVVVALSVNIPQHLAGGSDDGRRAVGAYAEAQFLIVPILWKIVAEGVGV